MHRTARILTGGEDGTVRIWDAVHGSTLNVLHEHSSCVNGIDFAPDGDTFVTASCDKTIKLWSLKDQKVLATLAGNTQEVDACKFIDDGKTLVSLSRYTTGPREVRFWDVATRSPTTNWLRPDGGGEGMVISKSGRTLVTFTDSGEAKLWKRKDSSWVLKQRLSHCGPTAEGLITPDEAYLLIPERVNRLCRFDLQSGLPVNEFPEHMGKVVHTALSPDGTLVATASGDSSIRVFAYPSGTLVNHFLGHEGNAWQVAWSPRGDSIASVGSDGTLAPGICSEVPRTFICGCPTTGQRRAKFDVLHFYKMACM